MKLYLLQLARFRPSGSPVPGYVIQTDDGLNILVDTGLPYPPDEDPQGPADMSPELRAEDYVVNRLATIGLAPEDIHIVICTHFDGDHAGNHEVFTKSELVVQRAHYAAARAGHPRFASNRAHWDHPGLHYRLVDGDMLLVPGVELIETSGHVPGHQAVLVRLPETGPVLLAIDAIPNASMLDPGARPIGPMDADEAGVRASTRKLVELARGGHTPRVRPRRPTVAGTQTRAGVLFLTAPPFCPAAWSAWPSRPARRWRPGSTIGARWSTA
jgi:N-acyl homoserine lactone hydrolase